jgi:hypothetical protein
MSIWSTKSIDEAPEVILEQWNIFEVKSPYWEGYTRHFVGYNISDNEGRVSSAIQNFDPTSMQGITRSGRVYKLVGDPGWHKDAEYVWCRWCNINHVEDQRNITKEFKNEQESRARS